MASLAHLPDDIYYEILTHLPFSSHISCRLVNKAVGASATAFVFRHVRLAAAIEPSSFLSVAASDALSQLVRHVTLDVDLPLSHRGGRLLAGTTSDEPEVFLRALMQLHRFRGLRSLQLRFSKFCGQRRGMESSINGPLEPEETDQYRYVVLDVIFHCLAGLWTPTRQAELEAWLDSDAVNTAVADANDRTKHRSDGYLTSVLKGAPDDLNKTAYQPVALNALTVINLADSNDPRLTSSLAFQRILALPSLQTLKLLVTFETSDIRTISHQQDRIEAPAKYDFLANLPTTWLRPSMAANLRTLMLYCGNYWGWCPKFDPRTINPCLGDGGGFPALQVLSLGNFVFSHKFQAEWIAGLGRGAGRQGLEELYLDDCPIMWQGRIFGPLDKSVTELLPSDGSDARAGEGGTDDVAELEGAPNTIRISNKGYPLTDIVTSKSNPDLVEYENTMRWHTVLALWRERMTGLKVFAMGSGTFDNVSAEVGTSKNRPSEEPKQTTPPTIANANQVDCEPGNSSAPVADIGPNSPSTHIAELAAQAVADRAKLLNLGRRSALRHGMSYKREDVLQYIRFEGAFAVGPWVLKDFRQKMLDEDDGLQAYEKVRRNDEVELESLMKTAAERR